MPGGLNQRILLAWIAYKSDQNAKKGAKAEQEASRLFIQQILRFSTENQAQSVLDRLRAPVSPTIGPWLTISTRSRGARGNAYSLGPAARTDAAEWVAFGRQLFGPTGLLTPYISRPILLRPKHGQGINGCLVIGFVDHFGPVTQVEIVASLKSLIHRDTVVKSLRRAVSADLILSEDGQFFAPRNLLERVRNDEIVFGGRSRASFLDNQIGTRQYESQIERLGGATLERLKSMLRKMHCFYCGSPPLPERGDYEHFPPKKWGGGDDVSLLLPICIRCNRSHGAILKLAPRIERPKVTVRQIQVEKDLEETARWFFEVFLLQAVDYARALNERRIEDARDAAMKFFPHLIALKSGVPIVSLHTGETTSVSLPGDLSVSEAAVQDLEGLPRLLGG